MDQSFERLAFVVLIDLEHFGLCYLESSFIPSVGICKNVNTTPRYVNENQTGQFRNQRTVTVAGARETVGSQDAASQDVKKDVFSLRYIALPNWFHEAHLDFSTSNAQDACKADAPESNGNSNPTATSTNPPVDQMETLTVETPIPTVSSPVPTACLDDSQQPSSDTRLISKRVTSQDDTPSLDNILTLSNRFKDILGVTTNTCDTDRLLFTPF
uniref:Uncharacterized protein n=1 Tax=Tanacetum cinerariifolium TaxID=118510 RepID=A0A6L2LLL2_TANCI|nr:hypothetical protein [Tanacetum cinerariifolium]